MRKKLEGLRRRPTEILSAPPSRGGGTDLGITIVELWAETADQLSDAQNAIAAEAVPGQRFSSHPARWLAWGGRETAAARTGARSLSPDQSTPAEKERLCFRG